MITDPINVFAFMPPDILKYGYEQCCEEYRRRLCEMWDLDIHDSWWVPSDRIGDTLVLNDLEITLDMDNVRLFVDNNISYEDFMKWWEYNLTDNPFICARAWFTMGARPEILTK